MQSRREARRNWGIDLLRIVCMLMVPTLHVLRHGGVLAATKPLTMNYELAWLIETACSCAVDCFALISGYVGYGHRHRFSALLRLCFQALFYTLGWTTLFLALKPELVGRTEVLKAFLPFVGNYWYLTAYFCLYFFMPHLDSVVRGLSESGIRKLIGSTVVVFSLLPTLLQFMASLFAVPKLNVDLTMSVGGYSFVWLAALYVLGACLRKLNVTASRRRCALCFVACVALSWGWRLVADALRHTAGIERLVPALLTYYISPTVLGCAICLLLLFAQLGPGPKAISFARVFAPPSFGVYLWHDAQLPRTHLLKGAFAQLATLQPPLMVAAVLVSALAIWLTGSLIDLVRSKLYVLIRVDSLCDRLGGHLDHALLPERSAWDG